MATIVMMKKKAPTTELIEVEGPRIEVVPIQHVHLDPINYRTTYIGIEELASSITEQGNVEIIHVKSDPTGGYVVSSGNRRFSAMAWNYRRSIAVPGYPLGHIPAIILAEGMDEREERIKSLISNTQRHDLNPMEEAIAYVDVLRRGISFDVKGEKVYVALTDAEMAWVYAQPNEMPADQKANLSVLVANGDRRLPNIMVVDVLTQLIRTISAQTKLDAVIKRIALTQLRENIQEVVAKKQLSLDFAESMTVLDHNRQQTAFEHWRDMGGKMLLVQFRSLVAALYGDQKHPQSNMFDADVWAAKVGVWKEEDRSKQQDYGYRTDPATDALLASVAGEDGKILTRSMPNIDTWNATLAELLRTREGDDYQRLADIIGSLRQAHANIYWVNKPADPMDVQKYLKAELTKKEKKPKKKSKA